MENITNERAMAVMRIQRKEDFTKIAMSQKYRERKRESSMYRRIMVKWVKKKVGVVEALTAEHLEGENKGYPKGFKDYKTYDGKDSTN